MRGGGRRIFPAKRCMPIRAKVKMKSKKRRTAPHDCFSTSRICSEMVCSVGILRRRRKMRRMRKARRAWTPEVESVQEEEKSLEARR